jgi:SAM-dependent methyltransferase
LPESFQAEFTGERIIPGLVEENLLDEHLARYRFAVRFIRELEFNGRLLDAGCGAGYGAAALAESGAQVLGIDVAEEAVAHARANYSRPGVEFQQCSCTTIPAGDATFQLITAFEVIEHIADWREFLREARRVLDPAGLFLVSTPNRLYYAESREKAGPNPFHVHEFTAKEFREELSQVFPYVKLLLQNHVEGIGFSGDEPDGAAVEISERQPEPDAAHFFLAVCSAQPVPPITPFVYISNAGNVLQTRGRHIALLEGEIAKKNQWIQAEKIARAQMIEKVTGIEQELEQHNQWARAANEEAARRAQLVADLQAELRKSNDWAKARDAEAIERGRRVEELQAEVMKATQWAQSRDTELAQRDARVLELQDEVMRLTDWAKTCDAEAQERGSRVVELQEELAAEQASFNAAMQAMQQEMATSSAGYEAAIAQWRRDKETSDRWAMDNEVRLTAKQVELEISQDRVASLQADKTQLEARVAEMERLLQMIAQSRWVKLGRVVRVGPEIQAR